MAQDTPLLDSIDKSIIELLSEDGRMSYSDIASKVGLSRPGVTERIANLRRRGIIERFTISVPPQFVRKRLPVYFELRFQPKAVDAAAKQISAHPDIVTVNLMSVKNSLHIHGFFHDIGEVAAFVDEFLVGIDGVIEIKTDFLMKRYKMGRV